MNIPAIGAARGIFEMFVPGAFVILNIFTVIYTLGNSNTQQQFLELASHTVLSLVILICFGYLVGVIVRLFGTETPDQWSARLLRLTSKAVRTDRKDKPPLRVRWDPKTPKEKKRFELWVIEDFPYIGWVGYTHTFGLGQEDSVLEFYKRVWADRQVYLRNKTFFDFCKTLINSVDERAADEMYSAEAVIRYLTGMFYSLLMALALMATGFIVQVGGRYSGQIWLFFLLMFLIYLCALWAILRHYRIVRIKEVGIVFSATYRHRELFEPPKPEAPLPLRTRLSRALAILTGHGDTTSKRKTSTT